MTTDDGIVCYQRLRVQLIAFGTLSGSDRGWSRRRASRLGYNDHTRGFGGQTDQKGGTGDG